MNAKNLPEAEAIAIATSIVIDNKIYNIYCDVDEILSCEEEKCAKEIYRDCIEFLVKGNIIKIKHIDYIRSGKIIIFDVDGRIVCLCACRKDVDVISTCKTYNQII
jgi:hypothetical protein